MNTIQEFLHLAGAPLALFAVLYVGALCIQHLINANRRDNENNQKPR